MRIINFAFNPWGSYWKRNQTLFYLLSSMEQVKSALFVNPLVWIADFFRSPCLIREDRSRYLFTRAVDAKIKIKTPVYLPLATKCEQLKRLNHFINSRCFLTSGDDKIILILNDLQADRDLVDMVADKAFLTIFDWSDDFVEFSNNEEERIVCQKRCEYYCTKSDFVLTINEDLRERALAFNENAFVIRNATNFFTFSNNCKNSAVSLKIRSYGDKVVGYIGWLNSLRLDLDLIYFIAERRPQYQFIFMGPMSDKSPLGQLIPGLKNVHILPPVPYAEYPACLGALDVCILPNLINAHTSGNDPIKIYDYLASGRPIVATRTAGTERFAELLYLSEDKATFLSLLDQAVHERPGFLSQERIEAARLHSWQQRITQVKSILQNYVSETLQESSYAS